MLRSEALPIAEELLALLAPACVEIAIAGSVRRQKPEVHDLEFVLLPTRDLDMFDNPTDDYPELDTIIKRTVEWDMTLEWDRETPRNGPKLKRLKHAATGLVVELYIADEKNFGNTLAIRTGCWEFSRGMMTSRSKGGQMPLGMRQADGYLWFDGKVVPCRNETDYFDAIGLRWREPEERTPELAARLWGHRHEGMGEV